MHNAASLKALFVSTAVISFAEAILCTAAVIQRSLTLQKVELQKKVFKNI